MATTNKFDKPYWKREEPKVIVLGRNVFKLFLENGKMQVYPKVDTAPNGVGRGTTIDLEVMTMEELDNFIKVVEYAKNSHINHRESFQ